MTLERFSALLQFVDKWGSLDRAMSFELLEAYAQKTQEIAAIRQTFAAEVIALNIRLAELHEPPAHESH